MQRTSDEQFRLRVLAANPAHHSTALASSQDVSHLLDQPGIVQVLYRVPDELASYAKLPYRLWVNHSRGEYVNWLAHTNGVESFWALVK